MNPARRLEWLKAIISDPSIKGATLRVAGILACHHDQKTRQVQIGIATLANEAMLTETSIRTGLRELSSKGFVSVDTTGGGQRTSQYSLHFPNAKRNSIPSIKQDPVIESAPAEPQKPPKKKQARKNHTANKLVRKNGYASDFIEFYDAYPRHDGKMAASRAWSRLTKRDKDLAKEGLKGRCWPDEAEYILMPSTYLNQRRWEDEGAYRQNKTRDPFA